MFEDIISFENLCVAWREFARGKKLKKDVAEFSFDLAGNLFALGNDLKNRSYQHGAYQAFKINDPKPRIIHKACVRDRVLHHAMHRVLYPHFDRKFIYDTYSNRDMKGTHRAVRRFEYFARKVSKNNTRTCWILKCDIQKFFASIDQPTLLRILGKHISDQGVFWLIKDVVGSFESNPGKGMPLGNVTSQLLSNVYMNEFDYHVKHRLRAKYYVRYADDFVFLSENRKALEDLIPLIAEFLGRELKLSLHPRKVAIQTWASGVDFLGWVCFPDHKVLRMATKRRMLKRIRQSSNESAINSYLGMLQHGNAKKLKSLLISKKFSLEGEQ